MSDTSKTAAEVQAAVYRRLTGAQRLALACELSAAMREMALARLRHLHPEWSALDLKRELLRYAYLPHDLPSGLEERLKELSVLDPRDAAQRAGGTTA